MIEEGTGRPTPAVADWGAVSATPEYLDCFVATATAVADDLSVHAGALAPLLDELRQGGDVHRFIGPIDPLDVDVAAAGVDLTMLHESVAGFSRAMRRIDTAWTGAAGLVLEQPLGRFRPGGEQSLTLFRHQDYWVLDVSEGSDEVEVTLVDGRLVVRVRSIDGDHPGAWHEVRLDDEQSRALVIRAGGGNDVITLDPGIDLSLTVLGGSGNDLVGSGAFAEDNSLFNGEGGAGDDHLYLGAGDDIAFAGDGDDLVAGGWGRDHVQGQSGSDVLLGGFGRDNMWGGQGADRLHGGRDRDQLEGGSGDDVIVGQGGDDTISGGRGDDQMLGGTGDDRGFGSAHGHDMFAGGYGDDHFIDTQDDIDRNVDGDATDAPPGSVAEHHVVIEVPEPIWTHGIVAGTPDHLAEEVREEWLEHFDSSLVSILSTTSGQQGFAELAEIIADNQQAYPGAQGMLPGAIVVLPNGRRTTPGPKVRKTCRPQNTTDWGRHGRPEQDSRADAWQPWNDLSKPDRFFEWATRDDETKQSAGSHISWLTTASLGDGAGPLVVLLHEFGHAADQLAGGSPDQQIEETATWADGSHSSNIVSAAEISVTGLTVDGQMQSYDTLGTDRIPSRPHPEGLVENTFRADRGDDPRLTYVFDEEGRQGTDAVRTEVEPGDEEGDEDDDPDCPA